MTSRERIQAALNHRQPDRVPVDFGSSPVSGIAVGAVYRLRKALGLLKPGDRVKVAEPYQMLGEIEPDLMDILYSDCAGVGVGLNRIGVPNADWKPWTTFDGAEVLVPGLFNTEPEENGDILQYPEGDRSCRPGLRMPKGGFYHDAVIRQKPIVEDALDPADNLEEFGLIADEYLDEIAVKTAWLEENTDRAILFSMPGSSLGNVAAVPGSWMRDPKGIRDIEEWYVSHMLRPDYIKEVYARQTDTTLDNLVRVKEAAGNRIDIIYLTGTDFGGQRGPLFSADMYRDMYKPNFQRVCGWIHENTTWKTMIHTCGGVRELLDDIIESGFDIVNPVQTSAEGMDPKELKRNFGARVVFHGGGVDTQKTLPHGRPEDVYDEVSERIAILNEGGGYIFNTIHNIQSDVPVENIIAMLKAIGDSAGKTVAG